MSSNFTPITAEINEYIEHTFAREDDLLKNLRFNALEKGMPDIAITSAQGQFLQFLLHSINARYVLEIGSLAGYSAIMMARVLPANGKLIAVEMNAEYSDVIKMNAAEAGLGNIIEVHTAKGLDFLKNFKSDIKFDFIFVDADKESYFDYFKESTKLLRKGGIFAADNALAFGDIANTSSLRTDEVNAIREFNKNISSDAQYHSCLATIGDGLAIAVKLTD